MEQQQVRSSKASRVLRLILPICVLASFACTAGQQPAADQTSTNRNVAQSKNANGNAASQPAQATTGSIEVSSSPPGARVLLVQNDEAGASEPQARGVTPTTITGLKPGKYTVDLEMPGHKFFQKEINVKAGSVSKVAANLKKQ